MTKRRSGMGQQRGTVQCRHRATGHPAPRHLGARQEPLGHRLWRPEPASPYDVKLGIAPKSNQTTTHHLVATKKTFTTRAPPKISLS